MLPPTPHALLRFLPSHRRFFVLSLVLTCVLVFLVRPGLLRPDTTFDVQTKPQTAERWKTVLPVAIVLFVAVTLLTLLLNRQNWRRAVKAFGFCLFGLLCTVFFLPFFSVVRSRDQFRSHVALLALACILVIVGWGGGPFITRLWQHRQNSGSEFQILLDEAFGILAVIGLALSLWLMFSWLREPPTW